MDQFDTPKSLKIYVYWILHNGGAVKLYFSKTIFEFIVLNYKQIYIYINIEGLYTLTLP